VTYRDTARKGDRVLQRVYSWDFQEHWTRSQSLGLNCPLDVFEQLFFDHHGLIL
jgi:hypothetical protein